MITLYWNKVGDNLLALTYEMNSPIEVSSNILQLVSYYSLNALINMILYMFTMHMQVHSFLQIGKCSGKDSISIAVDVASNLMTKKGLTILEELRDNISDMQCGLKAQTRRFHQLDDDLKWNLKFHSLKVPVVYLDAFSDETRDNLI